MNKYKIWIDAKPVDTSASLNVINPATEELFTTIARSDKALADQAIASAKAAQVQWKKTDISERRRLLLKLADAVAARADDIAKALTQEQGKPLADAHGELAWMDLLLRDFAALDLPVKTIMDNELNHIELHRVPLGVVACITPWNFPLVITGFKVPMALLAGNTVILKPAPTTPITTAIFAEICASVLPPGVLNTVVDDNDLGAYLTQHPDIAKVSFTGSTATGSRVMQSAAGTLKRITLEMGGNDAAIILPDVNVKEVAENIFNLAFMNNGQVCMAIKRVYAHESICDALCDELVVHANNATLGNGLDEGVRLGPLNNKRQFDIVMDLIESARESGTILCGGNALEGKGYFIAPTIVRDVKDGDRLVDSEQFGPVLPIISYKDTDEAIAGANGLNVGLGASVWSADADKARAIALEIEAGTVWINTHIDIHSSAPFCGAKQSGIGAESALEGLLEFTQIKVINQAR